MKWQIGDSLSWRSWCYFEAQVWKRIVTLPLLSFLTFFYFGGLLVLFYFLWASLAPFIYFLTWDNALIMKIITLLFTYNSRITTRYLEQNMTMWMPPAVYRDMQWIKSDMYENYEGGLATNTMSTTWSCKEQYDNNETCHNKRNGGKLHGNISRNGYGNAIIGRYGDCFEEGK